MAIPVSLDEAKAQLRILDDELDNEAEVQGFVEAAAAWVETYTGHILVARDVTETFHGFGAVTLRAWPIKPGALPGVAYVDAAGSPIAITGARLDLSGQRARVLPPSGPFYSFRDAQQTFTVTIRAGDEDDDTVPGNIKRAMLLLIGAYDADREGGATFKAAEASARRLCGDFRARRL